MKVKDLIEQLRCRDGDSEVIIRACCDNCIKNYSLNTTARERLADWLHNNHKSSDAAKLTAEVLLGRAKHAAGACGNDCVLCRPCVVRHTYAPQWALDKANTSGESLGGLGYVELSKFVTYSGHTELISFKKEDYDITEDYGEITGWELIEAD